MNRFISKQDQDSKEICPNSLLNLTRTLLAISISILGIGLSNLSADSLKINKTGTIYQNVKTSTEKGVVTVDFEDGSQKRFRTKDVTVKQAEVVWLAEQEKEEPSFIEKLFGPSDVEEKSAKSTEASQESEEEESSIPYLGEGIFGGVAFLFLILP